MNNSKFIQITSATNQLFALDEDGDVWVYKNERYDPKFDAMIPPHWIRITGLRDPYDSPSSLISQKD